MSIEETEADILAHSDEVYLLRQKGVYVQPATRAIDLNTIPADGNEYIYQSRLKDELVTFPPVEGIPEQIDRLSQLSASKKKKSKKEALKKKPEKQVEQKEKVTDLLSKMDKSSIVFTEWLKRYSESNKSTVSPASSENDVWALAAAREFSDFANQLKLVRKTLEEKYPQKDFPNVEEEKECCLFCLGSQNYVILYEGSCPRKEPHLPLLNYVLHLSQNEVSLLLKYSFKWFLTIGMNDLLGKWVCALFACLIKPLSKKQVEFLEGFYDACMESMKDSEGDELARLRFISALLAQYFCVKAYKKNFQITE